MTTGRELWKFNANGVIESHTAYHNGIVYATAEDSHSLFAINATTGTEIWTFSDPAQEVNGSPSLTDKYVFFGANDKCKFLVELYNVFTVCVINCRTHLQSMLVEK